MIAQLRGETHRQSAPIILFALVALAWLALVLWGSSPYARYLSHHELTHVRGGGPLMLVFIGGWALMTVAMMLPTSVPLINTFARLVRDRSDTWLLLAVLIGGYISVWVGFGSLVYFGDSVIHELVHRSRWLESHAWLLSAGTLVMAGLYQFSPLKYHCLDQCRSPLSFVVGHWRGQHAARETLGLGAHHGLFCLGCCWSLMLVMFAIGVGSIGWMLALGAVMAIEKNVSWGRRLSQPVGVALLAWAMLMVLVQTR